MPTVTRLPLSEIESRICDLASSEYRVARDKVSPSTRIVEDLGVDSLAILELFMDVEETFDVDLPDSSDEAQPSVYKAVFTRSPFRLSDLAELVYLQQGGPSPNLNEARRQPEQKRANLQQSARPPDPKGLQPATKRARDSNLEQSAPTSNEARVAPRSRDFAAKPP